MVSILALSFHPAFNPPKSGGEQRLYHIYNNLSNYYNITLISFTYPDLNNAIEEVNHNNNFREIRIPKTRLSMVLHHLIGKFTKIKECSAIITSIDSKFNYNFKNVFKEEVLNAEVVVFVYPYLFTVQQKLLTDKKVVYESHNVEYELMKQTLSESRAGKIFLWYVRRIEKSLSQRCDIAFAVSEDNKNKLISIYDISENKIYVSPNGVDLKAYEDLDYNHPVNKGFTDAIKCIFVGSYHPPNIEAIEQITEIAPKLPELKFIVAGSSTGFFLVKNLSKQLDLRDYDSSILKTKILISGSYNTEYWDKTPALWCEPAFKIYVSEDINRLDLKIFSPFKQDIEIEMDANSECKKVEKNINIISVYLRDNASRLVSFTCSKSITEERRILGIAILEVAYYLNDKKYFLDFTNDIKPPFVSNKANNVYLFGQISEEKKIDFYKSSSIALNPMLTGSGTNIKMLDYMAAKLPVVTTPVGARGLEIENYTHALICDIQEFPEKIMEVISDEILYSQLRDNGYKLVCERYDWRIIAKDMSDILSRKIK